MDHQVDRYAHIHEPMRHLVSLDPSIVCERLDTYLGSLSSLPARSACVKLIEQVNVQVNNVVVTSKKHPVYDGDRLIIAYEEPNNETLAPDFIPLDIRYEDDELLVLSKEAGLVCHPAVGHTRGTLANALVAHCGPGNLGTMQGEDRPGIVHRLDADTSGLMLAAKTNESQAALQDMIRMREVDRRYITLVHGLIAHDNGQIDVALGRSKTNYQRVVVSSDITARQAITTFTVLERFAATHKHGDYTLVECKLYTGRTHQIRVHMAYINHPLVGEPVYTPKSNLNNLGLSRQFLHSYRLSFQHPLTHKPLSFTDYLPDDLAQTLAQISSASDGRTLAGDQAYNIMEQARMAHTTSEGRY